MRFFYELGVVLTKLNYLMFAIFYNCLNNEKLNKTFSMVVFNPDEGLTLSLNFSQNIAYF